MHPYKLALGLDPANETMLRSEYHRSQIISLFFHYSSIHQSQICMVHPHKLAPGLGPAKEMIPRNENHRL